MAHVGGRSQKVIQSSEGPAGVVDILSVVRWKRTMDFGSFPPYTVPNQRFSSEYILPVESFVERICCSWELL
jgi:hypothetical protein